MGKARESVGEAEQLRTKVSTSAPLAQMDSTVLARRCHRGWCC